MTIDWFTIIAQAFNFMILVWLMKRFLYKPVLKAIDAREKKVAAELASAEKKQNDAKTESDEFKKKNEQFDQERATLLSKATEAAQAERNRLIEEAQKAAADLTSKNKLDLKNEEHNLLQSISQRIELETFAIARKALNDLAGATLEKRMVHLFAKRLSELNDDQKKQLTTRPSGGSHSVIVSTSAIFPAAQRPLAERTLKKFFGADAQIKFKIKPDLISGIEVSANGRQFGWSIAEYLTSLEENIDAHHGAGHEI